MCSDFGHRLEGPSSDQPPPPEHSPASTRSEANYQPGSNNPPEKVLLLRQVWDGEGGLIQVCIPFTTFDWYNCRSHSKGLREDPESFLNLTRGIFQAHDPTWADIQSLLSVLLTREGKAMVFSKAQEEAKTTEIGYFMLFSD